MKFVGRAYLLCVFFFGVCVAAQAVENKSDKQCTSCHSDIRQSWLTSDHAKSMAIADKNNVLADFTQQSVAHHGQKVRFYKKSEQHWVAISSDGKADEQYQVKYVFGHSPLQQYLVETQAGRLQVLPFAWDARDKTAGGQRWYPVYDKEEVTSQDRLHWQQPLQNWNGMCADCHSDGLTRNYNLKTNKFATTWDNINVGCLSCHDDKTVEHNKKAKPSSGHWVRPTGHKTAHWQPGEKGKPRDNRFMDTCFACHSLRQPLTDGFYSTQPFLNQFTPQLLSPTMYHGDGQINEEVYVYGSFLQSKMFASGVNCLDCHDKHTYKVKVQGNGLCLQCHAPATFDSKSHHQHPQNSEGAQCVNCHMPQKRYMGVDDRRDHSFKIPRPDLSLAYNTPNACNQCHEDKSATWATNKLQQWHGKPKLLSTGKQNLMALNNALKAGQSFDVQAHWRIVADEKLDVISRATALLSIGSSPNEAKNFKVYLNHSEPLLRLAAVKAAIVLPPNLRVELTAPLLTDEYKSIRVAAAQNLVGVDVLAVNKKAFEHAFTTLQSVNNVNSWRAEGRLNQGILEANIGDFTSAEKTFIAAIATDPYMEASYTNLSQLYRVQQKTNEESATLKKGIVNLPKSASLTFAYGLYFVRQKDKTQALGWFKKSVKLAPNNTHYSYVYQLALDELDQINPLPF